MRLPFVASVASTLFLCSAAFAQTDDLSTAIQNNDIAAIEAAAAMETSDGALARGVLAALRRQDETALASLPSAGADPGLAPQLRRDAWIATAGVYVRQGRYAQTVAALEAADAAASARDEESARDAAQTLLFARTLADVAPMQAQVQESGQVEIEFDMARLPRAEVVINGRRQRAVLDTGANFSTITESAARRLRLRMIEGDISVGATGNDAVAGHLAVADTLSIAGGEFHDVVFIVLPDSALSFAGGIYRIPAIVGFPVLSALGRVTFSEDALSHRRSGQTWNSDSNLLLNGLHPIALVTANDNDVRMFIDSGAQSSSLTPLATTDYPILLEGAGARDVRMGGAGGSRTYEDAAIIPRLAIGVSGRSVDLEDVHVVGGEDEGRHGVLGQDVLRAGFGYVIDFEAMRFELLPAP